MANQSTTANLHDELTLKLWGGDESTKGELLVAWGGRVEKAVRKAYPTLSKEDVEDVVAEAIRRFWIWRGKYDPGKAKIFTMLYRFADQVAAEHRAGRLKWQQQQIREKGVDADFFKRVQAPAPADPLDDVAAKQSPLQKALADCFVELPELQQDILRAYGDAGSYDLEASVLGVELGRKHKDGVPIPAGTIRTYKSRAWDSLDTCMKRKQFDLKSLGYSND